MSAPNDPLIVALPSKGRLHDLTLAYLKEAGFEVRRSGDNRSYGARLGGAGNVEIIYLRPDEIPARIEHGDAHIGITGEDLYRETAEGPPLSSMLMSALGFGAARLVAAVPQSWIDVQTMEDLDEAATQFRQRHGRSLRVATKYPRLARAFFAEHGLVEYRLVESLGATEGTPAAGVADIIVDITSTGATLAQNHLKEIAGGTILSSQACIIASLRQPLWTRDALQALSHIVEQIEARQRAASKLMLRFRLPSERVKAVVDELGAQRGGTVTAWSASASSGSDAGAQDFLVATCERSRLHATVSYLKSCGATEVIADRSEFIFGGDSPTIERFEQLLRHLRDEGR